MSQEKEAKLITRLRIANHALELLKGDELPFIREFLTTAFCEFNTITNSKAFWSDGDDNLQSEREASTRVAVIRPSSKNLSQFHVFAEPGATQEQLEQFAESMRSFMAVIFAAVGLDMTAIGELSPEENKSSNNSTDS